MKSIAKALYLIDDNEHPFAGWEFDPRGLEKSKRGAYVRFDFEKVFPQVDSLITRHFRKTAAGTVTLEANFTTDAEDGFLLALYAEDGTPAVGIRTEKAAFVTLDGRGTGVSLDPGVKTSCKAVVDLDKHTYTLAVGNVFCGSFSLPAGVHDLQNIAIGIVKGYTGALSAHGVKLYADYLANERFLAPYADMTPYDMTFTGDGATGGTVASTDNTFSKEDIYYYRIRTDGHDALLSKKLDNAAGNLALELRFIDYTGTLDAFFGLDDCGVTVQNGKVLLPDGTAVCDCPADLWNTLRLEYAADGLLVRFNGKDKGVFDVPLPASYRDLCIGAKGASDLGIDDILVFPLLPLPADYVAEPHPVPSKAPYHVGVHVFSSWRFGFWRGTHDATWSVCTPYDELTPYMGYYDEGIPEVSDWEVKWMSEHGIDFQLQCWYGPANITEPIKFPGFSHALHDGYFNSVYKNYGKFAVMWENNFTGAITLDAFKKYLVPYFIEYYFKDPGYYTIDGKPVFSIYNIGRLKSPEYFGSEKGAKEALTFLREATKAAGFPDVIILCAGGAGGAESIRYRENIGVEGSYNYNLGTESYSSDFQKGVFEEAMTDFAENAKTLAYVPTVSVGFNCVARHDKRHPSISMPEYDDIMHWVRDTMLPDKRRVGGKDDWQRNMVLLSCWNEFDEGHYINPSNLHGFGFLDTIRRTFTDAPDVPTDDRPTEAQKRRIDVLFPEGHAWLRPERRLPPVRPPKDCKVVKKWDFSDPAAAEDWGYFCDAHDKEVRNGLLCGTSDSIDPQIITTVPLSVPTSSMDFFHVRMRVRTASGKVGRCAAQFYYTTDTNPGLSGSKCVSDSVMPKDDGFADLYMPTGGANGWSGNMDLLRLDPLGGTGSWEIACIELLDSGVAQHVVVDGADLDPQLPITVLHGEPFVPLFARSPLMNPLDLAYRWNRAKGQITLLIKDRTLTFTKNSDKAVVDGREVPLAAPLPFVDGVPAIPMSLLCKVAGYAFTYDGTTMTITTV